jgi:hypothetical protein
MEPLTRTWDTLKTCNTIQGITSAGDLVLNTASDIGTVVASPSTGQAWINTDNIVTTPNTYNPELSPWKLINGPFSLGFDIVDCFAPSDASFSLKTNRKRKILTFKN